jgi:hypothetical protein
LTTEEGANGIPAEIADQSEGRASVSYAHFSAAC